MLNISLDNIVLKADQLAPTNWLLEKVVKYILAKTTLSESQPSRLLMAYVAGFGKTDLNVVTLHTTLNVPH